MPRMHTHDPRRPFRRLGKLAALPLFTIAACHDDTPDLSTAPPITPLPSASASAQGPFYYYRGERVHLDVDPTRIVIGSRANPGETARSVLQRIGVTVGASTAVPGVPDLWFVDVAGGRANAAAAVARLRAARAAGFVAHAYRTRDGGYPVALLDFVSVEFKPGVRRSQIDSLSAALGTQIIREPRPDAALYGYRLRYPQEPTSDPLEIAATLDRHPLVEWADPGRAGTITSFAPPTDPFYAHQWHLKNVTNVFNGYPVDINVEPAWTLTKGAGVPSAGGITIAVLDDGIEASHPDFTGGQVQFGFDLISPSDCGNANDGCATRPAGGDNHGTPIGGIIGARHDNAAGVAGIAPDAWITPIRVSRGGDFVGYPNLAVAMDWAWQLGGAHVISNSWGTDCGFFGGSNELDAAIQRAVTNGRGGRGTVVVFAAGNCSQRPSSTHPVAYPARNPNVIAVAAIQRTGAVTYYSSAGPEVDIAAPSGPALGCGGDIVTIDRVGAAGCGPQSPTNSFDYGNFTGTSAAAPQVAAAAALLIAKDGNLTLSQVRNLLLDGADPWGAANDVGRGKLDVARSMAFTMPALSVTISGPGTVSAGQSYTWTANPSGGNGTYTYQWAIRNWGSSTWTNTVTTQTATRNIISATKDFWLRVTVTSLGVSTSAERWIDNINWEPTCGPGPC